jgi:hypothetical protein
MFSPAVLALPIIAGARLLFCSFATGLSYGPSSVCDGWMTNLPTKQVYSAKEVTQPSHFLSKSQTAVKLLGLVFCKG